MLYLLYLPSCVMSSLNVCVNIDFYVFVSDSHFDNRTDTGQQPQQSLPVTSNSTTGTVFYPESVKS